MNDSQRVLELLRRAVIILEDETTEPTPIRQIQPGEDEIELEGVIKSPDYRMVGDNIPRYTAMLFYRREHDGREDRTPIQAWRKVATWSANNLDEGVMARAIGKFETSEWTTPEGETRRRTVFSVRLFEAA